MTMPPHRRAAVALLVGVLAPLLIMGMHPTGSGLVAGGARLVLINHMVHGVSIAAQPLVFLGLLGLWRTLRSDVATAGLVCYAFGIVAILSAAVLSGFVAPAILEERPLLLYTGALNQAFAQVGVTASGVAIALWGTALWQSARAWDIARVAGATGVIVGLVLALGVVSGWLRLDVRGIVLVTMVQALWMLLVVAHLLKEREPTSG
jgi:hypothetical protein